MSDQMPDEVWLRRIGTWVRYPEGEHRYIRADLYDSPPQDEVEALRAALIRIADYERNWRESGEVALEDVQSMAREALGDG